MRQDKTVEARKQGQSVQWLAKTRDGRTLELRGKPKDNGQWLWLSKAGMDMIQRKTTKPGTALLVYVALSRLASDHRADTFTVSHACIAGLTGLSARTVQRQLDELQREGLIDVETPALRAPCTYRLLKF